MWASGLARRVVILRDGYRSSNCFFARSSVLMTHTPVYSFPWVPPTTKIFSNGRTLLLVAIAITGRRNRRNEAETRMKDGINCFLWNASTAIMKVRPIWITLCKWTVNFELYCRDTFNLFLPCSSLAFAGCCWTSFSICFLASTRLSSLPFPSSSSFPSHVTKTPYILQQTSEWWTSSSPSNKFS